MGECDALFEDSQIRPRSQHYLDASAGLYALYLKNGSELPDFVTSAHRLIYIGKADGAGGLKRRCHFKGGTRNHSPRKSLAAILRKQLSLKVIPILTKERSYKTWALEPVSERLLDEWMHIHLEVAILKVEEPRRHEAKLIAERAPLLNLTDCVPTPDHWRVKELRENIDSEMRSFV